MAQFTIDIPNLGRVVVDGPFATDDALRDLARAVERGGTSRRSSNQQRNDQLFGDLNDNIDLSIDSFDSLINNTNKSAGAFKNFNNGLSKTVGGFRSIIAGSDSVSGGFVKMVDAIGDGASSMLDFIPGVGAVVTAFTGLAGVALGFIQGLRDTNSQLMAVGASFKGGIDEFQASAEDGTVAMSSLSKAVITNSESFRMLNGGIAGGTKTITKAFKAMGNQQQNILYSMGYSTDEILGGMADFAAMAKLSGRDLNMEEVAKGGADYLKAQRELTRLTGKSAEQLKNERQELRSRADFIAFLNQIGDPKLREAVENGMLAVPDSAKEMVTMMTKGNPFTDPAMIRVMNQFPGLEDEFRALGTAVSNGTISQEEYTRRYNAALGTLMKGSKDQYSNMTDGQRQLLNAQMEHSDTLRKENDIMSGLAATSDSFNEGLSSSNLAMDKFYGPDGALSQAMAAFANFDEEIGVIIQSMGSAVGKFFGTNGEFQSIMRNLIDFGLVVSSAMNEYATDPNAKISDLWDKVYEAFTKNFRNIFDITSGVLGGWLTSLGNMLSSAIEKGIQWGFDGVLAAIGYETDTKEQRDAVEAIAKLPEELKGVIQQPQLTAGEARSNQLSPEKAAMREAYSRISEVDDLASIGYVEEKSYMGLGPSTYRPMTPAELAARDANKTVVPNATKTNNALGNVFEPKPGGHIIRVAEAMSPELVAPATRTADGKLGLEISGVQLDNSKLLSRLDQGSTETNRLLNSLIGVNSAMLKAMDSNNQIARQAAMYAR